MQVAHRVRRDQLALVNDDHLLTSLLDFGENVSAKNYGVITRQTFDQVAGLVDLLGIQSCGWFVKNQNIGIVNNCLRQADALAITFR